MTIIAWATLIILSFIFIFIGLALIIYLTFFINNGANPSLGVAVFLLTAFIIAALLPRFTASPFIPAALIAAAFLVAALSLAAHFLLPYLDNGDLVKALRPLIIFSMISGLMVAVVNLLKIFLV